METQVVVDGPYLDEEEREQMESYDRGEWQALEGTELAEMQAKLTEAAQNTLAKLDTKSERMNIRMTKRDMQALKQAAAHEGLPYQSLVTSVLHKFTEGRLVDIEEAKKILRV
jgi:predicted DNA binding CopG/RHH family protein